MVTRALSPAPARQFIALHFATDDYAGLKFERLLKSYYKTYAAAIRKPKLVKENFLLDPEDIAGFDFEIPVYLKQYGQYFFVKKINNYISGKTCLVELLRLDAGQAEVEIEVETPVDNTNAALKDDENGVITF
jgi:hypothetical protein